MIKHVMTALTIFVPFTPLHQVHDDFTTFETETYFNDAFSDLTGYTLGEASYDTNRWEADYSAESFIYYAFPIYYDLGFIGNQLNLYYSNDYFNFYLNNFDNGLETMVYFEIDNYDGSEETLYLGRLNSEAMTTYIANQKGNGIVSDIVGTIGSMVIGLLGGLGTGIVGMFTSLFMDGSNISSLGIWIIALLGLSIALGAVAWVSTLIRGKQR